MSTETSVLVILFVIAVALDLYIVSRLQRYRRLRKESTGQNGVLQAYFPFLKFKPIRKSPIHQNLFRSVPRILPSAVMPIASLLLLNVGILQLRGQIWIPGALCILFAMAGLVAGLRQMEGTSFTKEDIDQLRPWIIPAIRWALILGLLSLAVVFVADHVADATTDYMAAVAWVCSLVLAMVTVWKGYIPSRTLLLEKIKAHRTELLLLSFILIVTLLLRTIDLSNHPYPLHGDESAIGIEARRIVQGEVTNLFADGWSYQSNWSFIPTVVSEILFGDTILAIRMAAAVAGILAVFFVYLVGREMFSPTLGLLAASLLATLPLHVHFSRVAVSNVVDSLFSAMMFWLLMRGIRKHEIRYFFTAGVIAGLSIYTYAGTRLILMLAFVTFLFLILREKGYFATHWRLIVSFTGGALLSAAPQAAFFANNSHIFLGRFGEATIFLNGWLEAYAALTGKGTLEILFEQFSRTVTVFIASPALGNFFNSPQPYLTLIGSILFLLGMAYSLAYLRELRFFVLTLWLWSVIVLGGVITMSPPANTRLLISTPALSLLIALGADKVVAYLRKFQVIKQTMVAPVLVALALMIIYPNIRSYMFDYRSDMYFADFGGEFEMEMATIANELGPDVRIFVVGVPHVSASSPTLTFIAPNNVFEGLTASQMENFRWGATKRAAFFAIPEYRSMLEPIRQEYPGGQAGQFHRKPEPDNLLFEYYILSSAN